MDARGSCDRADAIAAKGFWLVRKSFAFPEGTKLGSSALSLLFHTLQAEDTVRADLWIDPPGPAYGCRICFCTRTLMWCIFPVSRRKIYKLLQTTGSVRSPR